MPKTWRGQTDVPHPQIPPPEPQPQPQPSEIVVQAVVEPSSGPSWRYRMLLLAIGSSTHDGSDVTAYDRSMLLRMDHHLVRRAVTEGEAAAESALIALVEILRSETAEPRAQVH